MLKFRIIDDGQGWLLRVNTDESDHTFKVSENELKRLLVDLWHDIGPPEADDGGGL